MVDRLFSSDQQVSEELRQKIEHEIEVAGISLSGKLQGHGFDGWAGGSIQVVSRVLWHTRSTVVNPWVIRTL